MPKVKLTQRLISSLPTPEGGKETIYWDTQVSRFGLRIQGAARRYVVKYVGGDGRRVTHTLGSVDTLKLEDARRLARTHLGDVDRGLDPHRDQLERRRGKTMADLCEEYLARHARLHKRPQSIRDDERLIKKHVLPKWKHRKVAAIAQSDVQALHAQLRATPYGANRLLVDQI